MQRNKKDLLQKLIKIHGGLDAALFMALMRLYPDNLFELNIRALKTSTGIRVSYIKNWWKRATNAGFIVQQGNFKSLDKLKVLTGKI